MGFRRAEYSLFEEVIGTLCQVSQVVLKRSMQDSIDIGYTQEEYDCGQISTRNGPQA